MAKDQFAEATVGCQDKVTGEMLRTLFDRPTFRVSVVPDVEAVELCGALKNVPPARWVLEFFNVS